MVHHAIYSANSIGHYLGTRRFDSTDTVGNNLLVALLTFGDGWHNNHHLLSAVRATRLLLVGN
jgi:stearoyl-CoA desaturase (delta-9 desaturase)